MPTLNSATLAKLRSGASNVQFIHLIEAFDSSFNLLFRINNSSNSITSNNIIYNPFSFALELPKIDASNTSRINISFPNFSTTQVKRSLFKTISNINLKLIDNDFPNDLLYEYNSLTLTRMDISNSIIQMSFLHLNLDNKTFPFRKFSKRTHPSLYETE